jgi:NAD(P)-dependent dehydrogenase (short-subunit alcohol dehydrogenase family)
MECPGLHSLFSGFAIEFPLMDTPSSLRYHVASVYDRLRLLKIEVAGLGVHGRVEALARHPPAVQVPIEALSGLIDPNEFVGHRALIVGGSRGLGELTAKLLAAGGAHPIITYAVGRDDAQQVVEEIKGWGGECELLKYDVRAPSSQQLESLSRPVPYLYYYATCQINRRRTKRFTATILNEFLDFYVRGFYDLCVALRASSEPGLSAFLPSSLAVVERPNGVTEYAMAKAAAEVLCTDLNRSWPGMHITTVRLPSLLTDQTATLIPTENADSIEVILPIVRRVQAVRF